MVNYLLYVSEYFSRDVSSTKQTVLRHRYGSGLTRRNSDWPST